jgi:stage II sporulation protein D
MKPLVIVAACLTLAAAPAQARDVSVQVMGLFHSKVVVITPSPGKVLECAAEGARWTVTRPLRVRLGIAGERIVRDSEPSTVSAVRCDDGQNGPTEFTVAVPGKLSRRYSGKLEIKPASRELSVVVEMELETAVASVVAAESPAGAPLEALKAQAIAARSYFTAGRGRHHGFDFCDTTHCQFLRQPPKPDSAAARATMETIGMVLAYHDEVFAAMYSASCGGKTHTLEELGIPVRDYPYFAVVCDYCHHHPEKWVAALSAEDASTLKGTEESRIKLARKLGWKVVPGNSYSAREQNSGLLIEGTGKGHGIGLCQRGAADMARKGSSFQQILAHYYPNAGVKLLP